MNTKVYYLYRDADNYKKQNMVVLEGEFTQDDVDEIIGTLRDGEYFIPEMIGWDCERFEDWDDTSDHYFCELDSDSFELTDEPATILQNGTEWRTMTVGEAVANFEAASDEGWTYYPIY